MTSTTAYVLDDLEALAREVIAGAESLGISLSQGTWIEQDEDICLACAVGTLAAIKLGGVDAAADAFEDADDRHLYTPLAIAARLGLQPEFVQGMSDGFEDLPGRPPYYTTSESYLAGHHVGRRIADLAGLDAEAR